MTRQANDEVLSRCIRSIHEALHNHNEFAAHKLVHRALELIGPATDDAPEPRYDAFLAAHVRRRVGSRG